MTPYISIVVDRTIPLNSIRFIFDVIPTNLVLLQKVENDISNYVVYRHIHRLQQIIEK